MSSGKVSDQASYVVGVDVGGTFTDLFVLDERDGSARIVKVPSTRGEEARGFMNGVARVADSAAQIATIVHGTTVGTNALLERKVARTGIITTRGFRDVLEIGRIRMPDMFDLTWEKPKPLVPRRHRMEVTERMAADGAMVERLSETGVIAAGKALVAEDIEERERFVDRDQQDLFVGEVEKL